MRFVHDRIFPVICHLSEAEDRDLCSSANYLHQSRFSADQIGLQEDFCVPLYAATVELVMSAAGRPLDPSGAPSGPAAPVWASVFRFEVGDYGDAVNGSASPVVRRAHSHSICSNTRPALRVANSSNVSRCS